MLLLFGVIVLDLIGFGIVIPILPFLSPQLGASKMDIAMIIAIYAVFSGLCGPFWGRLSDRIGRKPVIVMCLVGAALSYVILGLAGSLWMIYFARGFAGVMSGNLGVASAMIADITPAEHRARGMGMIGAAFGLGLMLGPVLGGMLSGEDGDFTLPCLVAGLMSTLAVIAAIVFLPESVSRDRRRRNLRAQREGGRMSIHAMLKSNGNRLLALQFVVHNTATSATIYLFPLWVADLLDWSAREVGIVFGIQGALMAVLQGLLVGPLARILGELRFLRATIAVFLGGLLMAVCADSMPWMVASLFLAMSGATFCMPLLNSITSKRTPVPLRGRMLGTTSAASAWGRVLGPLLTGGVLATAGYHAAWLCCAGVVALYFLWSWKESESQWRSMTVETA